MNILVIGNGFDLAHELPTKYSDFLAFCESVKIIYESRNDYTVESFKRKYLSKLNLDQIAKDALIRDFQRRKQKVVIRKLCSYKVYECISNNVWVEYFINIYRERIKNGKNGWIDFEREISQIIQSLDADMKSPISQHFTLEDKIQRIINEFLKQQYIDWFEKRTYKELRDALLNDLNRLIRALEIYLTQYVEKIDCKLISPDIQRILPKEYIKIGGTPLYDTYILSFNYTNTYQRIYIDKITGYKHFEKYIDYIHGKADISNTIESNNMVLGIDEYLPKKRRNKETDFIAFKKFYQRIHKQTGCEYREWINTIIQENKTYKEKFRLNQLDYEKNRGMGNEGYQTRMNLKENPPKHNLYFFGHSLDITDKDILRDLILTENMHTTIFYVNKDVMGQQIANLVKVIGQDELIRRTGEKIIEFKPQQDMQLIDEQ